MSYVLRANEVCYSHQETGKKHTETSTKKQEQSKQPQREPANSNKKQGDTPNW